MLNLFWPYIPPRTRNAVDEVLSSRFIGQGPRVDQFEKEFSKKFKVPHAVALNSGTSALDTAYDLIGIGPGDEVISTPLTCTATNLALLRRGAKIVWADILKKTLCINPLDVRAKITERTKAIVQVHLGGIAANVGKTHIPVVSDACQALGIFNGDYTCCSFQAIKHITTGDGGMIVTETESEAHDAKLLRWFGIDREKKIKNQWQAYRERKMTFDIELPGTKRHMTDIAAAMGIVGLEYYDRVIEYRKKLFDIYRKKLHKIPGVTLIDAEPNTYWLCTLLVENRDDFAKKLFEADIDTNMVQVRNDIYAIFGGQRSELPVMNELEEKYISIPLGMHLTEEDIEYICQVIKEGW